MAKCAIRTQLIYLVSRNVESEMFGFLPYLLKYQN